MIVTLITDDVPYIFEDVTYISVDRDGTMFHVEHAEDFVLEDTTERAPKINAEQLTERLNISLDCDTCPRYTGLTGIDACKGHLSWLCRAINELIERNNRNGEKTNNG